MLYFLGLCLRGRHAISMQVLAVLGNSQIVAVSMKLRLQNIDTDWVARALTPLIPFSTLLFKPDLTP